MGVYIKRLKIIILQVLFEKFDIIDFKKAFIKLVIGKIYRTYFLRL